MKKVFTLLLAMLMLLSLCACGGNGGDSQASGGDSQASGGDQQSNDSVQPSGGSDEDADNFYLDIKFSNVFQPTEWNYKASEKLAEMITERTEGHITVTYYGQNELDCYGDSVTQAVNNANWMGLEEPSLFADYVGDAATLIGPMLYNSDEEYNYVMESDLVKDVCDRLAAENIHILDTHYSFGFRSVVTNLDVKTPDDLKGHQLRATSSALFTKTLECLGATPVPMSFTECLSAISSGVVEGFEGSTSTLSGAGAPYELVKKVALTNHLIATRWLFMPEDLYQSIPTKWRDIIDECAYECGMWEQTSCREDEDTQKEMLAGQGVTWNEVDLDAFTAACEPVYDWICEEYGADPALRGKLVELINEYRANNG